MRREETKNIKKFKNPKKKKGKTFKIVIVIFILAVLGVGIYLLSSLSTFDILKINVKGNSYYTEEQILASSGITCGNNVFGQTIFIGNKNLKKLSYIEDAKIDIKFPNEIVISLKERTSCYYALNKEKNIYYRLNKEGYILEEANERNANEIILIGITFDDEVEYGKKINEIDIGKLAIYEKIKEAYEKSNLTSSITKASFENSLTTITLNDKLSVIFPNITNLKYNIAFLEGIIKNIGEDSIGVIDLTKENPTFSNF